MNRLTTLGSLIMNLHQNRMSYFLSDKNLTPDQNITIEGDEALHIMLSRRFKPGEHIFLQGSDGRRFEGEVVKLNKKSLDVTVLQNIPVPPEPKTYITLFQSVVSEKSLDFIFQKGTELGASKIVLFNSVRTATKLSADQFNKKKPRWEKILWEAAKQSDRAVVPSLEFQAGLPSPYGGDGNPPAGGGTKKVQYDKLFLLDISGHKLSSLNPSPSTLGIIIGPEGGFTPEEVEKFKLLPNTETINLGPVLLKAETAAIASLAICRNLFD